MFDFVGRSRRTSVIGLLALVSALATVPAQSETPSLKFTMAGQGGAPACVTVPGRLAERPTEIGVRFATRAYAYSRKSFDPAYLVLSYHSADMSGDGVTLLVHGWADYGRLAIVLATREAEGKTDRRVYLFTKGAKQWERAKPPAGDKTFDVIVAGWRADKVEMIPTDIVRPEDKGCG